MKSAVGTVCALACCHAALTGCGKDTFLSQCVDAEDGTRACIRLTVESSPSPGCPDNRELFIDDATLVVFPVGQAEEVVARGLDAKNFVVAALGVSSASRTVLLQGSAGIVDWDGRVVLPVTHGFAGGVLSPDGFATATLGNGNALLISTNGARGTFTTAHELAGDRQILWSPDSAGVFLLTEQQVTWTPLALGAQPAQWPACRGGASSPSSASSFTTEKGRSTCGRQWDVANPREVKNSYARTAWSATKVEPAPACP